MLISLYRNTDGRNREHRAIFDRDGIAVLRTTVFETTSAFTEQSEISIGESALPATDRLVFEFVKMALSQGSIVLYGYIPSPSYPLTSRHIRESAGVMLEPDQTEVLPLWPHGRRRRGSKPVYLLFTVLSSLAK